MDKEGVIEKLEEVFLIAVDKYKNNRVSSVHDVIALGETIIKAKQSVTRDVTKAEQFIETKVERHLKSYKSDIERIAKDVTETLRGNR